MPLNPKLDSNPRDYRILVVDDETAVLDVMQEILRSVGWSVDAYASPVAALKKVKHTRFDALLLDLYMPEMPGLLLHAKLRVADRELFDRTIFVSGHFSSEELRKALEGTPRFVPKPFRAEVLVSAVSYALSATPRVKAAGSGASAGAAEHEGAGSSSSRAS